MKKNKEIFRDLSDTSRLPTVYEGSPRRRGKKVLERIFKDRMTLNSPNLMKNVNPCMQESNNC